MSEDDQTDRLGESPNPADQLRDALQRLAPEVFSEGRVDCDALRRSLGEDRVTGDGERYRLDWPGKNDAYRVLQTPTTATLRPQREQSVNFDTAEHVFIEGENLEVLKVLQKSYFGKVKLIYIDPPYNTGNDSFVYPDRFQESKDAYLRRVDDLDDDGTLMREGAFHRNSRENGHYHSNWLSMMLPRLYIARNLLREDGVIFVSCDDHEIHNLRNVMNEVFGEENFVATCVWQKRYSRENRGAIGDAHEYLLVFARDSNAFQEVRGLVKPTAQQLAVYKNPNNDDRGRWRSVPMTAQGYRPNQMYTVTTPSGATHQPPEGRCWSLTEPEFKKLREQGRIYFGKNGDSQPNIIRYLDEVEGLVPWTWWPAAEVGHTDEPRKEIQSIFGSQAVFDTPKPVRLLRRILDIATPTGEPEIVMDFFAGSGATMEAVLRQNEEDGGQRQCIAVQLAEPLDQDGHEWSNIAEVARARIRKDIESLDKPADLASDGQERPGFRSYALAPSNFRQWRGDGIDSATELADQIRLFAESTKSGAHREDILHELLLRFGRELTTPVTIDALGGGQVYSVDGDDLLLVLDCINEAMIQPLVDRKPREIVVLDALFEGTDPLRSNLELQCRDADIRLVAV